LKFSSAGWWYENFLAEITKAFLIYNSTCIMLAVVSSCFFLKFCTLNAVSYAFV